jgi:hypothetical protein
MLKASCFKTALNRIKLVLLLKDVQMAGEGSETENVTMKYGKKRAMTAKVFKFPHKHSKVYIPTLFGNAL